MLPVYHENTFVDRSTFAVKRPRPAPVVPDQAAADQTSHLPPTKDLGLPRTPTILRPGSTRPVPKRSASEYGEFMGSYPPPVASYAAVPQTTSYQPAPRANYPAPTPSYAQPVVRGQQSTRPMTGFTPYRAQMSRQNQDHVIRTTVSHTPAPETQHNENHVVRASASMYAPPTKHQRDAGNDANVQKGYGTASYSVAPQTVNTRRAPVQPQSRPPSSASVHRVEGVDFEMMTPITTRSPSPLPSPAPLNEPFRGRGVNRPISTYSSMSSSRSRSPSPGYGSYQGERPKQKRSFIDRAQERIHSKVSETLVKAGRRPLPTFQVNRVDRSPVDDSFDQYRPPPPPKDNTVARRQRVLNEQQQQQQQHSRPLVQPRSVPSQNFSRPIAAPVQEFPDKSREDEDWDIRSSEEELTMATSRRPGPTAAALPPTQETRRHFQAYRPPPPPVPVYELDTSDRPQPPQLRRCVSAFGERDDDSLFLDGRAPNQEAGYSFFSSEYTQRCTAAQMAAQERAEQQRAPPRQAVPQQYQQRQRQQQPALRVYTQQPQQYAEPARPQTANPYGGEQFREELPRTRSTTAFSREQLELARLPSPLDLSRPRDGDDRRLLPSQTVGGGVGAGAGVVGHHPPAGRTLVRKKATQQLR
ncbi:hypothetical protein F5Y16DRAFT_88599 [Xylariaceae sp. FL0255]|nr:hypothetical protein F5Y16DRAFT_88599 [Xylariaceae sp. FL0255]